MNIHEMFSQNPLFGKYALDRSHAALRCSRWSRRPHVGGFFGTVKAYKKLSRQPGLERSVRVSEPNLRGPVVDPDKHRGGHVDVYVNSETKQPISIAEAEKITEDMINSFSTNRLMRELIESASMFAGADTIGGARTLRKSRLQITKFER